MKREILTSVLLAAILGAGCAQHFLHGAKIADGDPIGDDVGTVYVAPSCTKVASQEATKGPKASYHRLQQNGAPVMVERNLDTGKGSIITNHWSDKDGEHYFCWTNKSGFEYVIHAAGDGERRVYNGIEVAEADGVGKPTSSPTFVCALKQVDLAAK